MKPIKVIWAEFKAGIIIGWDSARKYRRDHKLVNRKLIKWLLEQNLDESKKAAGLIAAGKVTKLGEQIEHTVKLYHNAHKEDFDNQIAALRKEMVAEIEKLTANIKKLEKKCDKLKPKAKPRKKKTVAEKKGTPKLPKFNDIVIGS